MKTSRPVLLLTLLVAHALAVFDLKEGTAKPGEVLVVDCTYDHVGTTGVSYTWSLDFASRFFSAGTTFTAIDVANLKTDNRANIVKIGGGLNSNFVKFNMITFTGHGAKFQYKLWAKVTTPNPKKITGNCVQEKGRR